MGANFIWLLWISFIWPLQVKKKCAFKASGLRSQGSTCWSSNLRTPIMDPSQALHPTDPRVYKIFLKIITLHGQNANKGLTGWWKVIFELHSYDPSSVVVPTLRVPSPPLIWVGKACNQKKEGIQTLENNWDALYFVLYYRNWLWNVTLIQTTQTRKNHWNELHTLFVIWSRMFLFQYDFWVLALEAQKLLDPKLELSVLWPVPFRRP
jgi:hypothetical protein